MNQFFKNVGNIEDNTAGIVNNSKGSVIEFKRLRGSNFVRIDDNRDRKEISFHLKNALTASSIVNDSNVKGDTVKNALNTLSSSVGSLLEKTCLSTYYVSSATGLTGAFNAFGEIYGPTIGEIAKNNILFNSGTGIATIQNEGFYEVKIITHLASTAVTGTLDSYILFFGTGSITKHAFSFTTPQDISIDLITHLSTGDQVYLYIEPVSGSNTDIFMGSTFSIKKI